ncbi:MAG: dihydrodipicolinate synthase family protein [Desulfurococcaceae archaeon]
MIVFWKSRLVCMKHGIITALITPLTKDGDLCVECLRQLIEFQAGSGVHGLYLAGTYGEGVILPGSNKAQDIRESP